MLAPDDLGEDAAATRLAEAMRHAGVEARPAATGRVNLHAAATGVFTVDKAMVDARQRASIRRSRSRRLPQYAAVEAGQMVATVKIIPFAVATAWSGRRPRSLAGGRDLRRSRRFGRDARRR